MAGVQRTWDNKAEVFYFKKGTGNITLDLGEWARGFEVYNTSSNSILTFDCVGLKNPDGTAFGEQTCLPMTFAYHNYCDPFKQVIIKATGTWEVYAYRGQNPFSDRSSG